MHVCRYKDSENREILRIETFFMEKLMQYIWQHRLFDPSKLTTVDGRRVRVIDTGRLNTDSGPDFFNAKISIDNYVWAGNVEIHRRASDWKRHNHHLDPAYDSVVLHIVEVADTRIFRTNGEEIPTLEMHCSQTFRADYEALVSHSVSQPCARYLESLSPVVLADWISSLAIERLQSKSQRLRDWLELYKGNWEEVCYIVVARSLGFGINGDAFERLARSLPLLFMQKHADSPTQVEAFLFGQAGLLVEGECRGDDYYARLVNEYAFLKNKFGLTPINPESWRLFRLRPANFPHRRLAMLAQYIHRGFDLFSRICEAGSDDELRAIFKVELSGYWTTHYLFGHVSPESRAVLGESAIDIVLINAVATLLYTYGLYVGNEAMTDRAMTLLESLRAEKNSIVRRFSEMGIHVSNALESQAVIQLYNEYCQPHKCLYCRIGHKLLSRAAMK